MLANGKRALDKVFTHASGAHVVTGADAFRLYDTYGIPLDITQVLAEEKGFVVDTAGFDAAMESHRRKAVESHALTSSHVSQDAGTSAVATTSELETNFTGYESLEEKNARVVSVWRGPKAMSCWVALASCPFYAEGGGQVGDRGHLLLRHGETTTAITVQDTKRLPNDAIALHCVLPEGVAFETLQTQLVAEDTTVDAVVDVAFRAGCQVHHSATHLLQAALKQVLGDHVSQAGSFVTADRLRFDFAHFGAVSLENLTRVESLVNELALQRLPVSTAELPRAQAEASGAICNFGDKYGETVRVVTVGDGVSREFCGGTHVRDSLSLFPFVILSEGSVAAGTRRIEAVAGVDAAKYLQTKDKTLVQLAAQLETTPAKVPERITKMQKQIKQLEQATQALADLLATLPAVPVVSTASLDVHVVATASSNVDFATLLRRRADFLLQNEPLKTHVVVMGSQVACISNDDNVHAGKKLQRVVKAVGGRGGGGSTFAQGSVPDGVDIETLSELFSEGENP
jgi:alanyl-tRNA synthetase